MSYRDILKARLKEEEKVVNEIYKCAAKKNTIGCGHNCDANPLPLDMQSFLESNGHITDEMIDTLLDHDIDIAEAGARKLFPEFDELTKNRQAAIVDLIFNMGLGTFSKFTRTIGAIRQHNWDAAAANLQKSKWYAQVKSRGPKVVNLIISG
jgi:lysozyme